MSNMSYCRFENTLNDLKDCEKALYENEPVEKGSHEDKARMKLIKLCKEIADDYYDNIDDLPYEDEE